MRRLTGSAHRVRIKVMHHRYDLTIYSKSQLSQHLQLNNRFPGGFGLVAGCNPSCGVWGKRAGIQLGDAKPALDRKIPSAYPRFFATPALVNLSPQFACLVELSTALCRGTTSLGLSRAEWEERLAFPTWHAAWAQSPSRLASDISGHTSLST